MTDLKTEQKTVLVVDYGDLDDFISFHYGLPFSVMEDQEMMRDSFKLVTINSKSFQPWEQEYLDRLAERHEYPSGCLHTLLSDLCNRGHLAAGSYLIRAYW